MSKDIINILECKNEFIGNIREKFLRDTKYTDIFKLEALFSLLIFAGILRINRQNIEEL